MASAWDRLTLTLSVREFLSESKTTNAWKEFRTGWAVVAADVAAVVAAVVLAVVDSVVAPLDTFEKENRH